MTRLLWACTVLFFLSSTFLDHRFLIIFLTPLQNTLAAKKAQIFLRSFLLKNQLSQNVFLQTNQLPTQAHCYTALILHSTEENQKQMVRWQSSMVCWFCLITSKCLGCTNIHESWWSWHIFAILSQDRVCFLSLPEEVEPSSFAGVWCCCFLLWLYFRRNFKAAALISELKLILHLFAAPY